MYDRRDYYKCYNNVACIDVNQQACKNTDQDDDGCNEPNGLIKCHNQSGGF
jgi:hypothetical protein